MIWFLLYFYLLHFKFSRSEALKKTCIALF